MIPVLSFFQPVRNFQILKELGVTVLAGPEIENKNSLNLTQLTILQNAWNAKAADLGFKIILKGKPTTLPANCIGLMTTIDEPNGKSIDAPASEVSFMRAQHPGVPIYISLAGDKILDIKPTNRDYADQIKKLKTYLDIVDYVTFNFYSKNRNATRYPTSHTAAIVKIIKDASPNVKVIPWIEVNDQQLPLPKPTDGINRAPTPDEITETINLALAAGAEGFGMFSTADRGQYKWPESYMSLVDRSGVSMMPQYEAFKQMALKVNTLPVPAPQDKELLAKIDELEAENESLTLSVQLAEKRVSQLLFQRKIDNKRDLILNDLKEIIEVSKPPKALISVTPASGTGNTKFGVLNWGVGSIIAPWVSPLDYNEEMISKWAGAMKTGGLWQPMNPNKTPYGSPLMLGTDYAVLDFEGCEDPANMAVPERSKPDWTQAHLAMYVRLCLDVCHEVAPNCKFGVIGLPVTKALAPIFQACDFINGGGYLMASEWLDRDLLTCRKSILDLKAQFPELPVFGWLNPEYTSERTSDWKEGDEGATHRAPKYMDRNAVIRYVAMYRACADQIVFWSGPPYDQSVLNVRDELLL